MEGLPAGVVSGTFKISPPLIKPSRLTVRDRGGVGKGLSTGWAVNFLIGCSFGCKFCYVDEIHKYSQGRVAELVMGEWWYENRRGF